MNYSIETDELTKVYNGKTVVDRLALRVERGSFYGFLGPNGAGKSTTIKMLTGIVGPDSGTIRLLGQGNRGGLAVRRRIGVVPEEMCLFENLTAMEYLVFIGRMYGLPVRVVKRRAGELLEVLALNDTGKTLAVEFSHGMKKKLSLGAALIHDPELLFLDEPFEGIDAITSRTIRLILERLVSRGATVFLTSHILEVVERLCSHVGIIAQGQLRAQGRLDELSAGRTLEDLFVSFSGAEAQLPGDLAWLGGGRG